MGEGGQGRLRIIDIVPETRLPLPNKKKYIFLQVDSSWLSTVKLKFLIPRGTRVVRDGVGKGQGGGVRLLLAGIYFLVQDIFVT